MNATIQIIPFANLALSFIPVLVILGILYKWSSNSGYALYAFGRMVIQLLLIGYVLTAIFESDDTWIVITVLAVMVITSNWIALRSVSELRPILYTKSLYASLIGGGLTLLLVTQGVLGLDPWYMPRYVIPLAGMIFASVMNSISLAAERMLAETARGVAYGQARNIALNAALIPIINSLLAVGLVSLPGMMTGQILSGISPLIAVRYQIMVMCMIFGSAGIATAWFLVSIKSELD